MKTITHPGSRYYPLSCFVVIYLGFSCILVSGQTQNGLVSLSPVVIETDQQVYLPGSNVYIMGSSWFPGEHLMLQVVHLVDSLNELPSLSHAHFPWTAIADSSGNVRSAWHIPLNENEPNAMLVLKATGLLTGRQTIWVFRCIPFVPSRRKLRIRH